ncbi:MAG: hypothetical protein GX882_06935 [Methanomicrobiales archaeon]|nr:hypothetical protein [Methanomicrobiales archaeon]
MVDDDIGIWNRALCPFWPPGSRSFTRFKVARKPVNRGRPAADRPVLGQLGFELSDNALLFHDEAFEIVNGCKRSRDTLNGVPGEGPAFKIRVGMGGISGHYILFRRHLQKDLLVGLE